MCNGIDRPDLKGKIPAIPVGPGRTPVVVHSTARLVMTTLLRSILAFALLFSMTGCDSGGDATLPVSMLENDAAEAVVRGMIDRVPDTNPGVPKSYSIILGELSRTGGYRAASAEFIARFADLGLRIISADSLSSQPDLRAVIDPETRVAVVLLQIRSIQQTSATTSIIETGWSYKQTFSKDRWSVDTAINPIQAKHLDTIESGDGSEPK